MIMFWKGQWRNKHPVVFRVALGALLLVVGLCVTVSLWGPVVGNWLVVRTSLAPADAIVVLGGGFPRRITHGIELYRQGLAPAIWLTGDVPLPDGSENDAQQGARLAEEHHVPRAALVTLASTSTWEDGTATVALAQQRHLRRLIIVTSWYHTRRALCVFKTQTAGTGITVYVDPAPYAPDVPNKWWRMGAIKTILSELFKSGYYGVRYGVNPWCS